VLDAAGLTQLFDVRVDGIDLGRLGLRGKPAPDMYLEAARRLGTPPARAVIFEDALVGVEAGRAGRFRLVIGMDEAITPSISGPTVRISWYPISVSSLLRNTRMAMAVNDDDQTQQRYT
jgi:beta-phosphoglucomutase-like phosphatase (HAD superfamily)